MPLSLRGAVPDTKRKWLLGILTPKSLYKLGLDPGRSRDYLRPDLVRWSGSFWRGRLSHPTAADQRKHG